MVDLGRQSLGELRQPLLSSADSSDDPYGKNHLFISDCLVCTKVKVSLKLSSLRPQVSNVCISVSIH